jgi:radical SAM-linked protein
MSGPNTAPRNSKVRIRFSKLGKIRFTSHRDVARIWERALRRAAVPVAYTEGFSPHPKLSFGLALSTGHESLGEYLDVDIRAGDGPAVDIDVIPARLDPCLPIGLDVQAAAEIAPGTASLQQAVTSCTWRIEVTGLGESELRDRVERCLAADSLVVTRERKGQPVTDDLRPAILGLEVVDGELIADLATQPRGVRPSELVALLGDDAAEGRVCRLHQWLDADGARVEPLPLPRDATLAPRREHPHVRTSTGAELCSHGAAG